MALLANVALFFALFLPLGFLIGWLAGFFVGPEQTAADAYPLFLWTLGVLPLLAPGLAWVPIAHFGLRFAARRLDRSQLRRLALVALPLGLLAAHLVAWGTRVLGLPLLVLVVIPGAAYGAVFRIPVRRRREAKPDGVRRATRGSVRGSARTPSAAPPR